MTNGFINVYKPPGITSMEAVRQIKKPLGNVKTGHCGTLDPLAEGVLPIAIGKASRIVEYVLHESKTYKAKIKLGESTTTYDAEGTITAHAPTSGLTRSLIEQILPQYTGNIQQVPPIYSALKKAGKPLYEYARKGDLIEIEPRWVYIHNIDLLTFNEPFVELRITCGAGTYIRSLADDLGRSLGCGAHMVGLIREQSSGFKLKDSIKLNTIHDAISSNPKAISQYLQPIDSPIAYMPKLGISSNNELNILHGKTIQAHTPNLSDPSMIPLHRAYNPSGTFLAIMSHDYSSGNWKPVKVFNSF